MSKPIVLSGIQPTGNLHIGNYLGAVKNWVDLQNSGKYECFFFIADYHSMTGGMTAQERYEQSLRTAAELLALGIDQKKSTLFIQSHIPEHTELGWIFNCITPLGDLKRMTQYKDKSDVGKFEEEFKASKIPIFNKLRNSDLSDSKSVGEKVMEDMWDFFSKYEKIENRLVTGLLTYPILQAADILLYHGVLVPVGQDQVQHVELTRDIARWFNNRYGNYFPETKPLLTEIPKVMSLLEPDKKMSKSKGQGHVIELADEPEVIANKLKKAVTATAGGGEAPGVANLLLLLKQFGDANLHADFVAAEKTGTIRYGDLKTAVGDAIALTFADFRRTRADLIGRPNKIAKELAVGAKRAKKIAEKTMADVRKLVGIR